MRHAFFCLQMRGNNFRYLSVITFSDCKLWNTVETNKIRKKKIYADMGPQKLDS